MSTHDIQGREEYRLKSQPRGDSGESMSLGGGWWQRPVDRGGSASEGTRNLTTNGHATARAVTSSESGHPLPPACLARKPQRTPHTPLVSYINILFTLKCEWVIPLAVTLRAYLSVKNGLVSHTYHCFHYSHWTARSLSYMILLIFSLVIFPLRDKQFC